MAKENGQSNTKFDQDKKSNVIYGTGKLLKVCIIDPDKFENVITSKDVVVNVKSKIGMILCYWMR